MAQGPTRLGARPPTPDTILACLVRLRAELDSPPVPQTWLRRFTTLTADVAILDERSREIQRELDLLDAGVFA